MHAVLFISLLPPRSRIAHPDSPNRFGFLQSILSLAPSFVLPQDSNPSPKVPWASGPCRRPFRVSAPIQVHYCTTARNEENRASHADPLGSSPGVREGDHGTIGNSIGILSFMRPKGSRKSHPTHLSDSFAASWGTLGAVTASGGFRGFVVRYQTVGIG